MCCSSEDMHPRTLLAIAITSCNYCIHSLVQAQSGTAISQSLLMGQSLQILSSALYSTAYLYKCWQTCVLEVVVLLACAEKVL